MTQQVKSNFTPFDFAGRLIVHVGTHKTGSTSIQSYCMDKYDSLLETGYLYPCSGRMHERGFLGKNHHPFIRTIICENTLSLDKQLEELKHEIANNSPQTIIISSEILSREYLSSEPFEYIRTLFPHAKREWIIALRGQADVLTSRYAELIKTRKIAWPQGIEMIDSPLYLDHRLRLEKLRYAVKDDPIKVLSYDAEKSRLLEAFFEIAQLGVPESTSTYHRNTSLPWGALHILRLTNNMPTFSQRYVRGLVSLIAKRLAKSRASFLVSWGYPLSKLQRETMTRQYRSSNRWVEKKYFDGRRLLNPDSSNDS